MLKLDEKIAVLSHKKTGELFERAIANFASPITNSEQLIWGQSLRVEYISMEEERANQLLLKWLKAYWGSFDLFILSQLQVMHIDLELATTKLETFLQSEQVQSRMLDYMKKNQVLTYHQFLSMLLDKHFEQIVEHPVLLELNMVKLKDKYLIQPIFTVEQVFWRTLFAKKIYSLFLQEKLEKIAQPITMMRLLKENLQASCSKNRIATIIHKLTQYLDETNKKSFELKQLHLFNIGNHFLSTRRSMLRLEKCIKQFEIHWSNGNFAITEKEQTLLTYFRFMRAVSQKQMDASLIYARFLLEEEKLNTYSIEILFEFGEILKLTQPNPDSIIKYYPHYYLEHVYAHILHTFVEHGLYREGLSMLKQIEIASCSAIQYVLAEDASEASLAQIEATIQRDIMHVLKKAPDEMMDAITEWKVTYGLPKHAHYKVAKSTVKHVVNILKILFVTEQFDCFEKLMEVYKKYLEIPSYTLMLKQFIQQTMDEGNVLISTKIQS